MVSEGDSEGGVDQVPDQETLSTHLDQQLFSALVRFSWSQGQLCTRWRSTAAAQVRVVIKRYQVR